MKSKTTIKTIKYYPVRCEHLDDQGYCRQYLSDTGVCKNGHQNKLIEQNYRTGVFCFTVEANGKSTWFRSTTEDGDEYFKKLSRALYRLTGYSDFGWGHYGTKCKTGGLNIEGKFSVLENV